MQELIEAAARAQAQAYCPYSAYQVGAAVLDESGRIHAGGNVENVSYGATICAERAAICRMAAEGGRRIEAIAIVTADGGSPCGMCLQVIAEFAGPETQVITARRDGLMNYLKRPFSEFLPLAFQSDAVKRTE